MRVHTYASVNGRPAQVSPMLIALIVAGMFMLLGAVFAIIGTAFSNSEKKLEASCTASVQAEVKEFRYSSDGLASPVYEYDYNGITHSFCNNAYSSDPVHSVGESVELMVNPDKPQQAYVPSDKTTHFISTIFTIVGFGAMGVAVMVVLIFWLVLRSAKKAQKKEEPWEM